MSAARTPGIAATTDAASAIWRLRSAVSSKSVRPSPRAAATADSLVVEVAILGDQRGRGRAIEKAGIEVRQPVMGGQAPGDRALARRRRTVDGDDHPERPIPAARLPMGS